MTLAEEVAAEIEQCYMRGLDGPDAADYFIAALKERGIDLDLAYQWRRVEAAVPEGMDSPRLGSLWVADGPSGFFMGGHRVEGAYMARCVTLDGGAYIQGDGIGPVAALSALADELENPTPG